jgi:hypothetical protein
VGVGEHPADEVLARFADAATSPAESRLVVRHLLARCPRCGAALRSLLFPEASSIPSGESSWTEKNRKAARTASTGNSGFSSEPFAPQMQPSFSTSPNARAAEASHRGFLLLKRRLQ